MNKIINAQRRPRLDDLYTVSLPEQPTLSPAGTQVVYVRRQANRALDRDTRSLWQVDIHGSRHVQLTSGPADSAPAWSPVGEWIAFLRADDARPPQLVLISEDGSVMRQITDLPFGAGAPVWSPDGQRLAFTALVAGDEAAVENDAPIVIDGLDYQFDGMGMARGLSLQLHLVELSSGEVTQCTAALKYVGAPAWSPDGTRLAFTAARHARTDITGQLGVFVQELDAADSAPRLAHPDVQFAGPVLWGPDGDELVVVGRTDTRAGHAGLLRIPLDGSPITNLAASLDRNVLVGSGGYPGEPPQLTSDGHGVLFCVQERGCSHLYQVGFEGDAPRLVLGQPDTVISAAKAGRSDTVVAVLSNPTSYGELIVTRLGADSRRHRVLHEARVPAEVTMHVPERREFTISDGTVVSGWLLRDRQQVVPSPLLLDIHGGPHNAWNGAADLGHLYHQVLAAHGWSVLLLNPRGSDGYGEAFYTATVGDWGNADANDLLEPVDQLIAEGIADPERLAVSGYSYGGFMTCHLTSRDERFAAAVAGGVVSDLVSMVGTADLGHHIALRELDALPTQKPEWYAERSPILSAANVRTPTLILQGMEDLRCPLGQAQQWFAALRSHEVPTRMVLYPGAGHLFVLTGRPSHRIDYNRRLIDWVQRHANGVEGANKEEHQ